MGGASLCCRRFANGNTIGNLPLIAHATLEGEVTRKLPFEVGYMGDGAAGGGASAAVVYF